MANKTNSKNSKKHSNSSKLFLGAALAVLILLIVSNYGAQLTGLATSQGERDSRVAESEAPTELQISIVNVSLDINGSTRAITAIKLVGTKYRSILINSSSTITNPLNNFLYLVINNRNTDAYSYIGHIIYSTNDGWESINMGGLSRCSTYTCSSNYQPEHFNYNTAGRIRYNSSLNPLRPDTLQIFITGKTLIGIDVPNLYFGTIEFKDGYSTLTQKGGIWKIPFASELNNEITPSNNEGFGTRNVGSGVVIPRSITYSYYKSSAEQSLPTSGSLRPPAYSPYVKNGFKSPAGVKITRLNTNSVILRDEPGPKVFSFECIDTDPSDIISVLGKIKMNHSNYLFEPHYSGDKREDSATTKQCNKGALFFDDTDGVYGFRDGESLNPRFTMARLVDPIQVYCNPDNLPSMRVDRPSENCASPACNAAETACAPSPTTFTCTETDGGDNRNTAGWTTLVASGISGQNWTLTDECYGGGATSPSVLEVRCSSDSPIPVRKTMRECEGPPRTRICRQRSRTSPAPRANYPPIPDDSAFCTTST